MMRAARINALQTVGATVSARSPTPERAIVPCAGCMACCKGERVVLYPEYGDDVASYLTEPAPQDHAGLMVYGKSERYMLAHKDNHECIYLGVNGCTIWSRAPVTCREFDCRKWYRKFTRAERRKFRNVLDNEVMRAGKQLLQSGSGLHNT